MTLSRLARILLGIGAGCLLGSAAEAGGTFVYVHDSNNAMIDAFSLAKDGTLTTLSGSPFAVPGASAGLDGYSQTMDYSRKRKTLYVGTGAGVSAMLVNADGSLTPVQGSPFGGGSIHGVAAIDYAGHVFVYGADEGVDYLWGFEAGSDGALALTPNSPYTDYAHPAGLADRKNRLFVSSEDETVQTALIGKDGQPMPVFDPLGIAADFTYNVDPDPKGKFTYVVDDGLEVFGFAVDKKTAALTPLADSPFAATTGGANSGASVAKNLLVAFAFQADTNGAQAYRIEKDGALTPLGTAWSTGVMTHSHALDSKAKWLIVSGPDGVASFAVDAKAGTFTPADEQTIPGTDPTPTTTLIVRR